MILDPVDIIFSKYIRLRDGECQRCGWSNGDILGLECCHLFGRRNESVRFDSENCDALCHDCHRYFDVHNKEAHHEFKRKQIGEVRYEALIRRANSIQKKNRAESLLQVKTLLDSLKSV